MSVGSEVSFALNICDVEMSFTTENFFSQHDILHMSKLIIVTCMAFSPRFVHL